MSKKNGVTRGQTDKEYAERCRISTQRSNFINIACKRWVAEHQPNIYEQISAEAKVRWPFISPARRAFKKNDYSFLNKVRP